MSESAQFSVLACFLTFCSSKTIPTHFLIDYSTSYIIAICLYNYTLHCKALTINRVLRQSVVESNVKTGRIQVLGSYICDKNL